MSVFIVLLMTCGADYPTMLNEQLKNLVSTIETAETFSLRITTSSPNGTGVAENLNYTLIKTKGNLLLRCKYFSSTYTMHAANGISTVIAFPQGSAFFFCPDVKYTGSVKKLLSDYQCSSLDCFGMLSDLNAILLSKKLLASQDGAHQKFTSRDQETICELETNDKGKSILYKDKPAKSEKPLTVKITSTTDDQSDESEKLQSAVLKAKNDPAWIKMEYIKGERFPDLLISMYDVTNLRTSLSKYDLEAVKRRSPIKVPSMAVVDKHGIKKLSIYAYVGSINIDFELKGKSYSILQWIGPVDEETIKRFTTRTIHKKNFELRLVTDPGSKWEYTYMLINKSYLMIPHTKPEDEVIGTIIELFTDEAPASK